MGDLGETWNDVTGTAGAEAAARSYERMAKSWIPPDLGETWGDVAQAAAAAEAAARAYQHGKDDPSGSEADRLRARSEYKEATKALHLALRTARVQEQDELWIEVMDAAQRAQAAGHAFFSVKHDLSRPESERTHAREAYAQAKSRVASLMAELEIIPIPEADVSEKDAVGSASAETPELVSEPSDAEQEAQEPETAETPQEPGDDAEPSEQQPEPTGSEESAEGPEWAEEEVSEPAPDKENGHQEPEESDPSSWDADPAN